MGGLGIAVVGGIAAVVVDTGLGVGMAVETGTEVVVVENHNPVVDDDQEEDQEEGEKKIEPKIGRSDRLMDESIYLSVSATSPHSLPLLK